METAACVKAALEVKLWWQLGIPNPKLTLYFCMKSMVGCCVLTVCCIVIDIIYWRLILLRHIYWVVTTKYLRWRLIYIALKTDIALNTDIANAYILSCDYYFWCAGEIIYALESYYFSEECCWQLLLWLLLTEDLVEDYYSVGAWRK